MADHLKTLEARAALAGWVLVQSYTLRRGDEVLWFRDLADVEFALDTLAASAYPAVPSTYPCTKK